MNTRLLSRVALVCIVGSMTTACSLGSVDRYGRYEPNHPSVSQSKGYVPAYRGWTTNAGEREAERKAIAQDMPFATVKPRGL